jgi:imidazole glycerol-phosphate synthase subunit HisF
LINKFRLISRLDIKSDVLIKHVQLEGVQPLGDPCVYAKKYSDEGIDEVVLMDAVASLYGRNHLSSVIKKIGKNVFIPMSVGGGIKDIQGIDDLLRSGADKVIINTAFVKNPNFINEAAKIFGSQCIVVQLDAKSVSKKKWEVYIEGARESTGIDIFDWIKKIVDYGAGELFVTGIDNEGMYSGMDLNLIESIDNLDVKIPVIFSGGIGSINDIINAYNCGATESIAMSHLLNIDNVKISKIKEELNLNGINVRLDDE